MVNSRAKGKRGELLWAAWLREKGYAARRGAQYSGSTDSPDVISDLPFHWEVKFVEALNINKAMDQAVNDSGDKVPAVAHKKSNKEWLITVRADDFIKMFKESFDAKP